MADLAGTAASEVQLVPDAPEDPEEFGLRIIWQSQDERIEAAEFLIATRLQEDVRRRIAREAWARRLERNRQFTDFVRQRTTD
jgi:hypothetical protein